MIKKDFKNITALVLGILISQSASAGPQCRNLFSDIEQKAKSQSLIQIKAPVEIKNKPEAEAKAVQQKNWMEQPQAQKINAYVIPGGKMLGDTKGFERNGFKNTDYIVSEKFFKDARLQVPASAHPIQLLTYGYYDLLNVEQYKLENTRYEDRLNRGGGRDHRLPLKEGSQASYDSFITEKGSGLNDQFSGVNGLFERLNYRKNGLQEVVEVSSEFAVVKQFKALGVPVIDHPQARLAPIEIQKLLNTVDQDGKIVNPTKLAAQTTRRQDNPRDSFQGVAKTSDENKYKIIAAMLTGNIGHGAINPENIANGYVNDPGHVTVGYPVVSGIYRCVLCKGIEGSRADQSMVGIMDYYFPANPEFKYKDYFDRGHRSGNYSTVFKINQTIIQNIYQRINLDFYKNTKSTILDWNQSVDFSAALKQKIELKDQMVRSAWKRSTEFIYNIAAKLLHRKEMDTEVLTATIDTNLSIRFMMQLGALRSMSQNTERQQEVELLISDLSQLIEMRNSFDRLINLFAESYNQSPVKEEVRSKLFSEYLPVNMIVDDITEAVKAHKNFETVNEKINAVIEKDSKPLVWEPNEWMAVIRHELTDYMTFLKNNPYEE